MPAAKAPEIPVSDNSRRFTAREAVRFLNERGYPLSISNFVKMCKPSGPRGGQGPPPIGKFGRHHLWNEATLIEWAEERARAGLGE
jgi:hypothetical protein